MRSIILRGWCWQRKLLLRVASPAAARSREAWPTARSRHARHGEHSTNVQVARTLAVSAASSSSEDNGAPNTARTLVGDIKGGGGGVVEGRSTYDAHAKRDKNQRPKEPPKRLKTRRERATQKTCLLRPGLLHYDTRRTSQGFNR